MSSNKLFKCDECEYTCSRSDQLKRHDLTHSGEKSFKCDIDECEYICSRSDQLERHKMTHSGEKSFKCDIGECEYICSRSDQMKRHKMTHSGEKSFKCDIDDCEYICSRSDQLERHKITHVGEKTYICNFEEWCCSAFDRSDTLKRHKKTHTPEGQLSRKKHERRLHGLLKEWGHIVDIETTIRSKNFKCLVDTNRSFSRIDFHIVNCNNMILLLECDEDQHFWYNISCEFSRMSDVRASLVKFGYTNPIYWIRYNPNGNYKIGNEDLEISRENREIELKNHLRIICSPDFIPDNQVNIHYMYYDLISKESGPEIMMGPDFPKILTENVSWTC